MSGGEAGTTMNSSIHLNLINRSQDIDNSSIVIFQAATPSGLGDPAGLQPVLAWQVIPSGPAGSSHPLVYDLTPTLVCTAPDGQTTPPVAVKDGETYAVELTRSGYELRPAGPPVAPGEVAVRNGLGGDIKVEAFRSGKVTAVKPAVASLQTETFKFPTALHIGVADQVREGQPLNSAILNTVNTEVSLQNIASADIVMTGGGPGRSSAPFQFTLQNIQPT
jgi:hypothetical protein